MYSIYVNGTVFTDFHRYRTVLEAYGALMRIVEGLKFGSQYFCIDHHAVLSTAVDPFESSPMYPVMTLHQPDGGIKRAGLVQLARV